MRSADAWFAAGVVCLVVGSMILFGYFVAGLWLDWLKLKRYQESERDDGR